MTPIAIFAIEMDVDVSLSTKGLFVNFMIEMTAATASRLAVNPNVTKRMIDCTSTCDSETDVINADNPRMPAVKNSSTAQTIKNKRPKNDGWWNCDDFIFYKIYIIE